MGAKRIGSIGGTEMRKLGLVFIVIISLVFTVSCVSKEVPVTETYYETEYTQEPYTDLAQVETTTPVSTSLLYNKCPYPLNNYLAILFHRTDKDIYWAIIKYGCFVPEVNNFELKQERKNYRIVVVQPTCYARVYRERNIVSLSAPRSGLEGFQPTWDNSNSELGSFILWQADLATRTRSMINRQFYTMLYPYAMGTESMSEALEYDFSVGQAIDGEQKIEEIISSKNTQESGGLGLPLVLTDSILTRLSVGFDLMEQPVGIWDILHMSKVTKLSEMKPPYEFPVDVMFQKGEWCLLMLQPLSCLKDTVMIDYVYDDVESHTQEITKYRQIPHQVEKQRTVMQTKKVPFWEAIFH